MSLIDDSYLIKEINIPANDDDTIQSYIDRYEPDVVFDLFGYELGTEVLAFDTENPGSSTQRIQDIVVGKEYTVDGSNCGFINPSGNDIAVKWNGLINAEKKSLNAYWVFYWFCRENESTVTNVGGAASNMENAKNVGFGAKAYKAYFDMIKLYGQVSQPGNIPSCYNFMYEHKDTYPEWVFQIKEQVNFMGI